MADFYANKGCIEGFPMHLNHLHTPPSWVDMSPVLNCQPLLQLTHFVVCYTLLTPLLSARFSAMADKWSYLMWHTFDTKIDICAHLPHLWRMCIPPRLCELLWKHLFDSLPISTKGEGCGPLFQWCPCGHGAPLDLFHVFMGCTYFPVHRLYALVLFPALVSAACGAASHVSIDPE